MLVGRGLTVSLICGVQSTLWLNTQFSLILMPLLDEHPTSPYCYQYTNKLTVQSAVPLFDSQSWACEQSVTVQ